MGYASSVVNFGEFLRSLMHDLGMDAAELARLVDRSERTIYNWLDAVKPSGRAVVLLADALDIPLEELRKAVSGEVKLKDEYRSRDRAKRASKRVRIPPQSGDLSPIAAGLIRLAAQEQSDRLDELVQMLGREALPRLTVAFVQQLAEWSLPMSLTDEFLYRMADMVQLADGPRNGSPPVKTGHMGIMVPDPQRAELPSTEQPPRKGSGEGLQAGGTSKRRGR